jgi:hypothetical protein
LLNRKSRGQMMLKTSSSCLAPLSPTKHTFPIPEQPNHASNNTTIVAQPSPPTGYGFTGNVSQQ